MEKHLGSQDLKRTNALLLGLLLFFYVGISLRNLGRVPMVYEDEPWIASGAWKIANDGIFGLEMFEGWHESERHCYSYMPLYPTMMAGIFLVLGPGLAPARLLTVLLGLLVMVGTFFLGKRLFDPKVGLLALLFLLLVRLSGTNPSSVSGILFLDMARIARYDMLVPAMGILSLHAWLSAIKTGKWWAYLGSGVLMGLSVMGHLYGVFWMPLVGVLTVLELGFAGAFVPILWMLLGFLLPCGGYGMYVSRAVESWAGQNAEYSVEGRFSVLDPRWYLENLLSEPERYKVGLRSATGVGMLKRVGLWSTVFLLPVSILKLGRSKERYGRVLWVSSLFLPLCFALSIHVKMMNYIVCFLPMWALVVGWGACTLWREAGFWKRGMMVAMGLAVGMEGASRILVLDTAVERISSYDDFLERVRREIPEGARVMGLPNYWFGMEKVDYHAFMVPIYLSSETPALPFEEGMERIHPEVVLIDDRMRPLLEGADPERQEIAIGFRRWAERRGLLQFAVVEDSTYGRMELWKTSR